MHAKHRKLQARGTAASYNSAPHEKNEDAASMSMQMHTYQWGFQKNMNCTMQLLKTQNKKYYYTYYFQ